MKKIIILLVLCYAEYVNAYEGIPFFTNYPSAVYQAHNRNFDVVCDSCGNVYIANFEGILHYDYSRWNILYTPGFSRVTRLFRSSGGNVWAGGYNVFGRIDYDKRGCIVFNTIASDLDKSLIGELEDIAETSGYIYLKMTSGKYYVLQNDTSLVPTDILPEELKRKWQEYPSENQKTNQFLPLSNRWIVQATVNRGLVVSDPDNKELFSLNENNGLCSNTVFRIATDTKGNLWGATDNGIFHVLLPSVFSRYTPYEGLKGEVVSIIRYKGTLYAGTLQGLYYLKQNTFVPVKDISQACWGLSISPGGHLYAATNDGVFLVHDRKNVRKIARTTAFSLVFTGEKEFLIGAIDGIYRYNPVNNSTEKISHIEKVTYLEQQQDHSILAKTLYGEIYMQKEEKFPFVRLPRDNNEAMTIYKGLHNHHWQTDIKGKNLQVYPQKENTPLNLCLNAVQNYVVRVIYEEEQAAWLGGDFGLIRLYLSEAESFSPEKKHIFIREILLNRDSVYRGGNTINASSGDMPYFESNTRNIRFSFATDAAGFTGLNEYRYRLDGYDSEWSTWNNLTQKEYANLSSGTYTFQVQSRDMYKKESEVKKFTFSLLPPFYLKWYSLLIYLLFSFILLFFVFKWRMRKLLKEKERLEDIVSQRTLQLVKQKNEIEEKSLKLEETLTELGRAQEGLVRQEKMATVGKLTQGLIDRILNPLNYINNFSHLTAGLLQDLHENLENIKDTINEDTYLDSADLIGMMKDNLGKIEDHGSNTTRVLKAMEEVLKDRNKLMEKIELTSLCRKDIELLETYYEKEIRQMHISVKSTLPNIPLFTYGNAELLGKTIMSLLNNGMYAVTKKYGKKAYLPEVRLEIQCEDKQIMIRLYDNGIGIETGILEKIFDPFFTTKTTGEAAGIGLYLSKEIILNHHGQITVHSEKNEYTVFTITLPLWQEE